MLVGAAVGHDVVHLLAGIDVADVAGVAIQVALELEPEPRQRDWRLIGPFAGDLLFDLPHLGSVFAHPIGALLGDLLEARVGREAPHGRDQILQRELEIGDHAEIDRVGARKARRVKADRDQLCPGRCALAEFVAEVEQYVGLAEEAHVRELRANIQRMPGRERF